MMAYVHDVISAEFTNVIETGTTRDLIGKAIAITTQDGTTVITTVKDVTKKKTPTRKTLTFISTDSGNLFLFERDTESMIHLHHLVITGPAVGIPPLTEDEKITCEALLRTRENCN